MVAPLNRAEETRSRQRGPAQFRQKNGAGNHPMLRLAAIARLRERNTPPVVNKGQRQPGIQKELPRSQNHNRQDRLLMSLTSKPPGARADNHTAIECHKPASRRDPS